MAPLVMEGQLIKLKHSSALSLTAEWENGTNPNLTPTLVYFSLLLFLVLSSLSFPLLLLLVYMGRQAAQILGPPAYLSGSAQAHLSTGFINRLHHKRV